MRKLTIKFSKKLVTSYRYITQDAYKTFKSSKLEEREGFEPSIEIALYTPLAGERLQPLGHLSITLGTRDRYSIEFINFPVLFCQYMFSIYIALQIIIQILIRVLLWSVKVLEKIIRFFLVPLNLFLHFVTMMDS